MDQIGSVDEIDLWYLYLIETASGHLYCGITLDVSRRFKEHCSNGRRTARFLRGKGPLVLRFVAVAGEHGDALRAEMQVKKLSRPQKQRLVSGDRAYSLKLKLMPVPELLGDD
ncbi:putative endonuclease [Thalassolituus maritimus]|uniref:Putative endonuclease n=2 Tax=Thalassolituus maritimus TaxID=484498 RepID=A0A1N7MF15_9GAMM|nr:GIY-YIG nuclease family protein [Thalassolituus maritimus]SIS84683.1 putative endonuclease [Thalassolituus maritimus]